MSHHTLESREPFIWFISTGSSQPGSRLRLIRGRRCHLRVHRRIARLRGARLCLNAHMLVAAQPHNPGYEAVARPYARREKLASNTATMPVKKMPSKVPAPPIEATGAPRPCTAPRLRRSAPISVPRLPLT
jgi:hypothetical protein